MLWMDSLRTSSLSGELNRIMVGEYVDPAFGTIRAQAYSQFRPLSFPAVANDATYDSIVLSWKYDLYTYGSLNATSQTIDIYEITQTMNFEDTYFFNTQVSIERTPIGSVGIRINPELFKQELEDPAVDTVITTKVRLNDNFGQRLFDSVNPEDTLFTNLSYFIERFKGLAILSTQSDKIFGINNFDANTVLTVYYHEGTVQKSIGFSLSNLVAFTQITADRSGTELSGLNAFYTEFDHPTNRYLQNGASIITKLDFTEFYKYMDTIPNIMINSAELSVTNVDATDEYVAPGNLLLAMMKDNNHYKTITGSQDTLDFIAFGGSLIISDLNKLFAADDSGGLFSLPYSSTDKTYIGYPTLFFQQLFNTKQNQYPDWALLPANPPNSNGKAVNRAVFPKDEIKLKIYYTRPLVTENP
jgi:hypothetical protein